MKYLLILAAILSGLFLGSLMVQGQTLDPKFIRAIHLTETSGRLGPIWGDNKKSYGPLQIQYACWKDATDFDRSIGGKYENCSDLNYSIKIFQAYCRRYESKALQNKDFEVLARLWNGGPNWRKKSHLTDQYWKKVQKHL